jgi:hypothetical protein
VTSKAQTSGNAQATTVPLGAVRLKLGEIWGWEFVFQPQEKQISAAKFFF